MPGKMARSDPRPSVRVTRGAGSGQHLATLLQEGRENANIDAGLGFIWRISAQSFRCDAGSGLACRHIAEDCSIRSNFCMARTDVGRHVSCGCLQSIPDEGYSYSYSYIL